LKSGKGIIVRMIWRIIIPTKIITGTRNIHLSAALKADGSIKAWGAPGFGTIGVPDGKGYTNIYSNTATFAALSR
jgi:hypothetical protein